MIAPPLNDLDAKWQAWKAENPRVYALFASKAREMLERSRKFGIGALAEAVRWEILRDWEKDAGGFKINNNFRAYIARDLVTEMPGLDPLIERRRVRGEVAVAA